MRTKLVGTLIAVSLVAASGLAAAEPLAGATGDGGGELHGEATGEYQADAGGATDAARENEEQLEGQGHGQVEQTSEAYEETKWRTYENASETERPERPECPCGELEAVVEQVDRVEASHQDRVQKAGQVDSEYVDAGADVEATGQADAWYESALDGVVDAVEEAGGLLGYETQSEDQVQGQAEQTLATEDELRGEVVEQAKADVDVPEADPSAEGELTAEHATQAATDAATSGGAQAP
jgi:hypothetical protein